MSKLSCQPENEMWHYLNNMPNLQEKYWTEFNRNPTKHSHTTKENEHKLGSVNPHRTWLVDSHSVHKMVNLPTFVEHGTFNLSIMSS